LERAHVRYFQDQPDAVGFGGIGEELTGDAQGPEEFLPFGRVKPMVDIVDFVKSDKRCHVANFQIAGSGQWRICG
jgi:hypothetical protein